MFRRNLKFYLFLMLLAVVAGCGGSQNGLSSGSSSILAGNAGLSPLPEDLGDLPLTIPNAFKTKACPITAGFSEVNDLKVYVSSPNAPVIDTNADQVPDTVVLKLYDAVPKTVIFSVQSLTQNPFPLSTIFNNGQLQPKILGGLEKDVNGNLIADIATAFANHLRPGTWSTFPTPNPFASIHFIPGASGAVGHAPFFETTGFEGDTGFANVACPAYRSNLCPGTHVVAVYVPDNANVIHCTSAVARIRIDP